MKTYYIQTKDDDMILTVDQHEETMTIAVQGKWYADGGSPVLPVFCEYIGQAPKIILDLSGLDYNWWDGFLRLVVTEYWRTSLEIAVITPPEHPKWVDMLIFCYHRSSIPKGARPGTLSIQCGQYVWRPGEELHSDFVLFHQQ